MQDSFQASTIKVEQPEQVQPSKKTFNFRQLLKPLAVLVVGVIVISGYYIFTVRRQAAIKDAQAAILSQAVMINKIDQFTSYKGQGGRLYQGNKNSPELNHKILLQQQLQLIKPVDVNGVSDSNGKVGFIFIGDSYTAGEFETLADFLKGNAQANQSLVLIDGAQSNLSVNHWDKSLFAWDTLNKKVAEKEVSAKQVQVIWINIGFSDYSGEFEADVHKQADLLENLVKTALVKYPETKVVYLSSPRYAGLSKDENYQEPQTYEAAFAVREIIGRQEKGELVFRQGNTSLKTEPALVWGPYIWNNDTSGNSVFGYKVENYAADGLILTVQGKQRLAVDLFDFWSTYEFSRVWFSP